MIHLAPESKGCREFETLPNLGSRIVDCRFPSEGTGSRRHLPAGRRFGELLNSGTWLTNQVKPYAFRNAFVFCSISSRTRTNTLICSSFEPVASAGSSNGQCCRSFAPGKTGQASLALSQTVTTKSNSWPLNSSIDLLTPFEMSMPRSFIASMASGWTYPDGWEPAEQDSHSPLPSSRKKPSAIWLRHELPVQRTSTRFMAVIPW